VRERLDDTRRYLIFPVAESVAHVGAIRVEDWILVKEVAMRATKLYVAALFALPIGALAQGQSPQPRSTQEQSTQEPSGQEHSAQGQSKLAEGQTSSSCINNFTFSQEFFTRYPNAGAACREVKVENGHKWARFDANVVTTGRNQLTANFVDRFNNSVGTITFDTSPDFRVQMNGQQVRVSSLQRGDTLSFWVSQDQAGFYAEPHALDSTKLAVAETAPAQR